MVFGIFVFLWLMVGHCFCLGRLVVSTQFSFVLNMIVVTKGWSFCVFLRGQSLGMTILGCSRFMVRYVILLLLDLLLPIIVINYTYNVNITLMILIGAAYELRSRAH